MYEKIMKSDKEENKKETSDSILEFLEEAELSDGTRQALRTSLGDVIQMLNTGQEEKAKEKTAELYQAIKD